VFNQIEVRVRTQKREHEMGYAARARKNSDRGEYWIAIHEAGHTVLTCLYGLRIKEVTIRRNTLKDGTLRYGVSIPARTKQNAAVPKNIEMAIDITVAGYVAASLFGRWNGGTYGDERNIHAYLAEAERTLGVVMSHDEKREIVRDSRSRVAGILRTHEGWVRRIADALRASPTGRLNGSQVVALKEPQSSWAVLGLPTGEQEMAERVDV
jgi:hypothetical protein